MTSLLTSAREYKRDAKRVLVNYHHLRLIRDPRHQITVNAVKTKVGIEEKRWQQGIGRLSNHWADMMLAGAHEAIMYAQKNWKVEKADDPPMMPPDAQEVLQALVAALSEEALVAGGVTTYLGLATLTSEASGQAALLKMGLGRTFAWAHPQNMARDLFKVRGSKIIQNMYDSHIDQLTKMIIDATNPRYPQTISQVQSAIKEQWPDLRAYQVTRIARTETATIWTDTQLNAFKANGIQQVNSILATGPSIPGSADYSPEAAIQTSEPCDECSDYAAGGPYAINDVEIPLHPNAVFEGYLFAPYGRLEELVRARYCGPAVVIHAGGHEMTIGPNHPMLTARGMVKAKELRVGDQLVYDRLLDRATAMRKDHDLQQIPLIEDAFGASQVLNGSAKAIASPKDLHGDAEFVTNEVEIVHPERYLLPVLNSSGVEELREFPLTTSDLELAFIDRDRLSFEGGDTDLLPTAGNIGGSGKSTALLKRGSRVSSLHRFRKRSASLRSLLLTQGRVVLADTLGERFTLLRCSFVRHDDSFEGWAFDGTTSTGIYNVAGFVVANCRCEAIPVLEDENGNPWLPPDQPWTGEAIGSLDSSSIPGEGDVQAALTPNVFGYRPVIRVPGVRRRR